MITTVASGHERLAVARDVVAGGHARREHVGVHRLRADVAAARLTLPAQPRLDKEAVGHLELVAGEERVVVAVRDRGTGLVVEPVERRDRAGALIVVLGVVELAVGILELGRRFDVLEVEADLDVVAPAARGEEPVARKVELPARAIREAVERRAVVILRVRLVEDRRVGETTARLVGRRRRAVRCSRRTRPRSTSCP